jgi:hypothetical protein
LPYSVTGIFDPLIGLQRDDLITLYEELALAITSTTSVVPPLWRLKAAVALVDDSISFDAMRSAEERHSTTKVLESMPTRTFPFADEDLGDDG